MVSEIAFTVKNLPRDSRNSVNEIQKTPSFKDSLSKMNKPKTSSGFRFFDNEQMYPDDNASAWFDRLVGIDDQKQGLLVELELLLRPDLVKQWSLDHHGEVLPACEVMATRAPEDRATSADINPMIPQPVTTTSSPGLISHLLNSALVMIDSGSTKAP